MAKLVLILGPSGTGKSSSIEGLNPEITYLMNADLKDLPFAKANTKYFNEKRAKELSKKENYLQSSDMSTIIEKLNLINQDRKFKVGIVDTANAIMMDIEMSRNFRNRKAGGQAMDKWMDLASEIYDLFNFVHAMRDDLIIYIMAHTDVVRDDSGQIIEKRMKTNGRKLEKVILESKATIVLFTDVKRTSETEVEYRFCTQSDGVSTAKSPKGMFNDYFIPNDLKMISKTIYEYYN